MIGELVKLGIWGVVIGHVIYFKDYYIRIIGVTVGSKVMNALISTMDPSKSQMMKTTGGCLIAASVLELVSVTLKWK